MKIYHLRKETLVAAPLDEVWSFFSDPKNLKLLTPPYMRFRVIEHTHTFEERGKATFMTDHVEYVPPYGIAGQLANRLFLHKQLQAIFTYREKVIRNTFPG